MYAESRMAEKCRSCQLRDTCDNKRMEACACFLEPCKANAITPSVEDMVQPVAAKHDYRDVKIAENTTVTIDLEELKEKMVDDFYKSIGFGFNCGG